MRTCYARIDTRSIADVTPVFEGVATINRIRVPRQHRGKGEGRALLKAIIDDADAEGVTLDLMPNPYGALTWDELRAWYSRYGFVEQPGGLMVRPPRGLR